MTTQPRRQSGYILLIILVAIIAIVVGGLMYRHHQRNERMRQEQADTAQALRAVAASEAQRADQERKALEARQVEDQKQRDALAVAYKAMDTLVTRWDDATHVAEATGRIALSGPVATLQSIHREVEKLIVPPCLDEAKSHLLKSMSSTVEGYVAFMRNDLKLGDVVAAGHMAEAKQARDEFVRSRGACPR